MQERTIKASLDLDKTTADRIDAVRSSVHMPSRAAYIRRAILEQLKRDTTGDE